MFEAEGDSFHSCGIQVIGYEDSFLYATAYCSSVSPLELPAGNKPDTFTVKFGDTETFSWPAF